MRNRFSRSIQMNTYVKTFTNDYDLGMWLGRNQYDVSSKVMTILKLERFVGTTVIVYESSWERF